MNTIVPMIAAFQVINNNNRQLSSSTTKINKHYSGNPEKNGLKCPKCGEDLYDTQPNIILTSDPAQKNIGCLKCDYIGYRTI